jgi:hypothetical protein
MRVLIALILIALLPLRGWAGDVMAVHMSAPTAQHVMGHAECHEHGQPAQAATQPQASPDSSTGHSSGSCASCQTCSTVALLLPAMPVHAVAYAFGVPSWAWTAYTSVDIALGQKPPIS